MDANLTGKAEQLATEIATQAKTLDDLNGLMKLMMKSALERMLDTEMDVHLGRKTIAWVDGEFSGTVSGELRCRGAYEEGCEESSQWAFTQNGTRRSWRNQGSRRRAIAMAPSSHS